MRSVRFRLTVWYAVLLLTALGLFSGAIWLSLRGRLLTELDEEVSANADRFRVYFLKETAIQPPAQINDELEEYCQALPPSAYLDLQGSSGYQFHYPARGHSHLKDVRSLRTHFTEAGTNWTLDTGGSSSQIHHTLELLQFLLLSLIPAVVAIACLGGAWMSRRALKPVDELTESARTIGIENLAQRLPVPATGDELERLTLVWNTMLERLDTAVKTLSQFAADASHELRTPLAVIRTSAELALRRERSAESYRQSLVEIVAEAERMTQLVEALLLLARNDARNAGMPFEPLSLDEVVQDSANEIRTLANSKSLDLRLHLEPAQVSGNRPALRRLFLALLDNAVKYSHPGGGIDVTLNNNGRYVQVEVFNQGPGIPSEDLPHVFERFYRGDKARTSDGHGLGLSLASSIATAHNGHIVATSSSGGGATFTVSIPKR